MKHNMSIIVLSLVALLLVACGAEDSSPEARTADVVMNDIYYGTNNDNQANPPIWTVPAGATFTLNLDNQGSLEHNWAIVKLGETVPVPFDAAASADLLLIDAGVVPAGMSSSTTITAPIEPGEYAVVCTVAGHYPLMQGRLMVEG